MISMRVFSVLFFLFLNWQAFAYESEEIHEKGDRKMDTADSDETTPTTVPAERERRGEGHFATTVENNLMNGERKQSFKAQEHSSGSGSVKFNILGNRHVDSDTGKRNMVGDSDEKNSNVVVDSNTGKRRPILDNMKEDGQGNYIRVDLDEKKRQQIQEMSLDAKIIAKRAQKAEHHIFDPEKATPEELEAYNEQTQEPFVSTEDIRIVNESMYETAQAEMDKFIVKDEEVKYEDGRQFKYKPSEYAREQKLYTRSLPPEKITDNRIFDVAKFACDDTYGSSHYEKFEIAESREYKMPSQDPKVNIYTYKVTVDVYLPSFEPNDPNACTVEIFTVRSVGGKFSMVSHEISPLECMDTPPRMRSGRVWTDLQQRHKEL